MEPAKYQEECGPTMGSTRDVLLHTLTMTLPLAGDRLVDVVHRAVTGDAVKGDPAEALDRMVDEGTLTPQAALYLGGLRQALHELAEAGRP